MVTNLLLAGSIGSQFDAAFYNFDYSIFQFLGNIQSDFLTVLAKAFSAMGSVKYGVMIAILGLVLCFFKKSRKLGLSLIFAVIIGTLITNVIVKPLVLRIRPYNTLQADAQFWSWYIGAGSLCESDYCFPSGHTTGAFEINFVLFLYLMGKKKKGVAWIPLVLAVLTAIARVYLMVHYATDVIAGAIIGAFAGIMGYLIGSAIAKAVGKRKLDDIVDFGRLFSKNKKPNKNLLWIVVSIVWVLIFAVSFVFALKEGGPELIRCAYDREYDCQNEAEVGSRKYPAINGEYYCKLHWKQLNEQFAETGSIGEPTDEYLPFTAVHDPVTDTDLYTFYNDPKVIDFCETFAQNMPKKVQFRSGDTVVTVTDPAVIQQIFDALGGVQVGGALSEAPAASGDESSYYTFFLNDGSTLTFGVETADSVLYNGTYYQVTDDNGAFTLITGEYQDETETTTAEAA